MAKMMLRFRYVVPVVLATGLGLLTAACGSDDPTATPTARSTGLDPTPTAMDEGFAAEWQALIAAAQAEGELVLLAGAGFTNSYPQIPAHFGQLFNIDVTHVTGRGREQIERLLAERGADRYDADLIQGGGTTVNERILGAGHFILEEIEPLIIHPEILDKSLWFGGKWRFGDVAFQKYSLIFAGSAVQWPIPVWGNTDLVDPSSFTSVWDVLDDKWKGQIVTKPPTPEDAQGGQLSSLFFHPDIGPDWIKRFYSEMDIQYATDPRLISDGLARGRYPLIVMTGAPASGELRLLRDEFDQPVQEFTHPIQEGGALDATASSSVNVITRAPHPNAAKLFVNWFYSREGQTAMHELGNDPPVSLRLDVPAGNTIPDEHPQAGVEYFERAVTNDQIAEARDYAFSFYQQTLGQ